MHWTTTTVAVLGLAGLLLAGGCAGGGATRDLTEREIAILGRLETEISSKERRDDLETSTEDLRLLHEDYVREEHVLSRRFAKARELSAMTAFLARVSDDLRETRRDVLLSRLVEVEDAEQEVLEARLAAWNARVEAVRDAYDDLADLVADAIEAEKLVLAHLDRPASARLGAFLGQLEREIAAFRAHVADSGSPGVRRLADRAEKAEELADKAQDRLEKAFGLLEKVRED